MTQEERWNARYEEVREFILKNKRNPSKHRIEEHQMLNFIKHNRKLVNKGEMRSERVEKFKELMELCERNRKKNQYV